MSVNIIQHWNKFKNFLLNKEIDNSISSNNSIYIDNSIQQIKSQNSVYIDNQISNLSSYTSNSLDNCFKNTGGTINGNIVLKSGISNYSVIPTTNQKNQIEWLDYTNNKIIGGICGQHDTAGNLGTFITINSNLKNNNDSNWIGIGVRNNGEIFTTAPTPDINSNGYNIANTYWVRTLCNNNYVNKSGGTFNGNINIRNTISNYSVIPSSQEQIGISFMDLNSYKTVGGIETRLKYIR